jgi:thiosulfate/3-mercaptopyruvate sulfurtransferase
VTGPLIEPAELAAVLRTERDLVVADVRWTLNGPPGRPEFEAGHIPGAQYVDLETQLSGTPGAGGRHPLPEPAVLQSAVRGIGVSTSSLVVVYDESSSQAASRLWWLLTDGGHRRTRVLNGGLAAWRRAGLPEAVGPAEAVSAGDFDLRPGHRRRFTAGEVEELAAIGRPLVDVRAADRYAGRNETIDPVAGHIPGAVNRPASDLLDDTGRFIGPESIAGRFAGLDEPVLYCGSGITAGQALLALESAGRSGVIYPGSWSEWITDPRRPVATGTERS